MAARLPGSSAGYARWCFKTDQNRFKSMGEAVNRCIEGIYAQQPRPSSFTITSSGQTYFIDFDTMKQRNMSTKFVRDIERQFVDAQTGRIVKAAPLLLLLPSGSVLAAANKSPQQSQAAANSTANAIVSSLPPGALPSYSAPKSRRALTPANPSKSFRLFQKREQTRSEMREEAKQSYAKIVDSVKNMPVDEQHRALARAVTKLLSPGNQAQAAPAIAEVKKLKAGYNSRNQFRMSKACRHQLALNLTRVMIGSGAPQW